MSEENKHFELHVKPEEAGLRLDKFILIYLPDISRSSIQKFIKNEMVLAASKPIDDSNYKVKAGETIEIYIKPLPQKHFEAKDIKLDVVYEDEHLIVLNKQAGLTVHPGAGNHEDTLVNALVAHFGTNLSKISGDERPGIVHRLDRDTSGLMVIAKTDAAHRSLAKQIEKRTLKRVYNAVIFGTIQPEIGTIEKNIGRSKVNRKKMAIYRSGGKTAITNYKILEKFQNGLFSLVECKLDTGRTHQIRVHLSSLGNSIIGDKTYGNSKRKLPDALEKIKEEVYNFPRQALHSVYISFKHPATAKMLEFSAPYPKDIEKLIKTLKS